MQLSSRHIWLNALTLEEHEPHHLSRIFKSLMLAHLDQLRQHFACLCLHPQLKMAGLVCLQGWVLYKYYTDDRVERPMKRLGAKKAKRQKLKQGLQPLGD